MATLFVPCKRCIFAPLVFVVQAKLAYTGDFNLTVFHLVTNGYIFNVDGLFLFSRMLIFSSKIDGKVSAVCELIFRSSVARVHALPGL